VPSPGESDQVNIGYYLPVWVSKAAVERDGLNDMGRARVAVHGPDTIEDAVQKRPGGGPGYRGADVGLRELRAIQACEVPQQQRLRAVFLAGKPRSLSAVSKRPGVAG